MAGVIDKHRSHSERLAALPALSVEEHEVVRILNCGRTPEFLLLTDQSKCHKGKANVERNWRFGWQLQELVNACNIMKTANALLVSIYN